MSVNKTFKKNMHIHLKPSYFSVLFSLSTLKFSINLERSINQIWNDITRASSRLEAELRAAN